MLGGPVESVQQRLHLLLLKHQDAIRRNTQATRDHAGEVESIAAALLELIKETESLQKLLSQVIELEIPPSLLILVVATKCLSR